MFSNINSGQNLYESVVSVLVNHAKLLERVKGSTNDSQKEHYLINNGALVSEFKHYETQLNKPAGYGDTELQLTLIIGYINSYIGTNNRTYLDEAIKLYDAYLRTYYYGQKFTGEGIVKAHYAANTKEPIVAHYPIDDNDPLYSGFKSVPLRFEKGVAYIPQGAPFFGEYLDKAFFVHRGHMETDLIDGKVKNIKSTIDWDSVYEHYRVFDRPDLTGSLNWINWGGYTGMSEGYDVDWGDPTDQTPIQIERFINRKGEETDINGKIYSKGNTIASRGKLMLADKTLTGTYLVNFSPVIPEVLGGRAIGRNELYMTEVLVVPAVSVGDNTWDRTSAFINNIDTDMMMVEASYMLYQLTNDDRYVPIMDNLFSLIADLGNVGDRDMFFRRSSTIEVPFPDGNVISSQDNHDMKVLYKRDPEGYVTILTDDKAKYGIEQNQIWTRVNQQSKLVVNMGARTRPQDMFAPEVIFTLSPDMSDPDVSFTCHHPLTPLSGAVSEVVYPLGNFILDKKPNGEDYLYGKYFSFSPVYGSYTQGAAIHNSFDTQDYCVSIKFNRGNVRVKVNAKDDASFTSFKPTTVYCKALGIPVSLVFEDVSGWHWVCEVAPNDGANVLTQVDINKDTVKLHTRQPNHGVDEVRPLDPAMVKVEYFFIEPQVGYVGEATTCEFWLYVINDFPAKYTGTDEHTAKLKFSYNCEGPATYLLGDCYIKDKRKDNLIYTPGVLPFSGMNERGMVRVGALIGQPYVAYQRPFVYAIQPDKQTEMENMLDFIVESKTVFKETYGTLGIMSAYSWNRSDNLIWSEPNKWTQYHWKDKVPCQGELAKTALNLSRGVYECVRLKKSYSYYATDFVKSWVDHFYDELITGKKFPNVYRLDGVPTFDPTKRYDVDYLSDWISCFSYYYLCLESKRLSGKVLYVLDVLVGLVFEHQTLNGTPNDFMNGGFETAIGEGQGAGNTGVMYAITSGKVLQALGIFVTAMRLTSTQDIYKSTEGIYTDVVNENLTVMVQETDDPRSYVLSEDDDRIIVEGYD